MRINLMDGSLHLLGGHPHDIDLRVTRTLVESGHDVHVYSHAAVDPAVQSYFAGLAPLQPLFSINPYAAPVSFDPLAGDIIKNLEGARITAAELARARPAELWLWPSLYPHQLLACAIVRTTARVSGCIHHPPDFFSPQDTAWWRYASLQARQARLGLNIGFIEPETRYVFGQLMPDTPLNLFPFPNDGCQTPYLRSEMKRIGIFGFQRHEKGVRLFQTLVRQLLAEGHEVVFHNSGNEKIGLEGMPGVISLGHVMDLDEEIGRCDLVLAPYSPEAYRYRGSGIVMSAISSSVPVVVPFGSAPGRLIEQNGAGTLFMQFTPASILAAIHSARDHYPAIAGAANRVAQQWKQHHGVARFVQAMLG